MGYSYIYIYTVVLGICQGSWIQYNHNAWATIASSVSSGIVTKLHFPSYVVLSFQLLLLFSLEACPHKTFWTLFFNPSVSKFTNLKPKRETPMLPYFFFLSIMKAFQILPFHLHLFLIPTPSPCLFSIFYLLPLK